MEMNAVEMDKVEQHGQSVKRVRSLYDMHRVPFGAVENLEDLITAIQHNRHFAMDFWALVGDLSARENGSLDDQEMLDVIVEGATGLPVTSLPEQDGSHARDLRQMLAGVDIGAPPFLPDPIEEPADALISRGRKESSRRPATVVSLPERARRPEMPETGGTTRRGAMARRMEKVETLAARQSIGEALSRLEQTSMELREQLAAIEEQIEALPDPEVHSDAEVHPDAAAELHPNAGEVHSNPEVAVAQTRATNEESAAEELVHRQPVPVRGQEKRPVWTPEPTVAAPVAGNGHVEAARVRAPRSEARPPQPEMAPEPVIFNPRRRDALSPRGLAPEDGDDDPSIVVPLAAYAEAEGGRSKGRRVALVALLLVALGGGGYAATHRDAVRGAWERFRPLLQAEYAGFVEKLGVLKREATAKSTEAAPSAANSQTANTQAAANGDAAAPAPVPSGGGATPEGGASTPVAQNSGLDAKSASAPPQPNAGTASPGTTADAVRLEPKARTDRESAAVRPRRESSEDVAEPEIAIDANVVRVPPTAMEANLVASRVPAYPQTAKAEGIEGRVVMEAVISKTGNVDRVHVIEGDRHLRSAAEDAVLKWRYRPYLVNGRPVEVATTVRVDFRLPRGMGR
jgi:TonB family protein